MEDDLLGVWTTLVNHTEDPVPVQVLIGTEKNREWLGKSELLEARGDVGVFLPIQKAPKGVDPTQEIETELTIQRAEGKMGIELSTPVKS